MNSDILNSQPVISDCINTFNTGFRNGDMRLTSPNAPSLNPEIPYIFVVDTALTFVSRRTTSPARFLETSPARCSNLMIKRTTGIWAFNAKICSDTIPDPQSNNLVFYSEQGESLAFGSRFLPLASSPSLAKTDRVPTNPSSSLVLEPSGNLLKSLEGG